jgi:hypothetical protein
MTLYKFTGGTLAKSSEVNSNFNLTLRGAGLTWINMLKDRALTMPVNGGIFAEAYTSADGRQTSVVTAETTAIFQTNKRIAAAVSGTTETTTGLQNGNGSSSSFNITCTAVTDLIVTQVLYRTVSSGSVTYRIDIEVASVVIGSKSFTTSTDALQTANLTISDYTDFVRAGQTFQIKFTRTAGSTNIRHLTAQSHSGSLFSYSSQTVPAQVSTDTPACTTTATQITVDSAQEITHTIPAGTFPNDMVSSFLTYDPAEFEAGADVDYKWRNDVEDVETGWLASDIVVEFTSLGFEPDQLIKRLKPKSSSPTAGYPSSRGVCVFGGKAL